MLRKKHQPNRWVNAAVHLPPTGVRVRVWLAHESHWIAHESHARWTGGAWDGDDWGGPQPREFVTHWQRVVGPRGERERPE